MGKEMRITRRGPDGKFVSLNVVSLQVMSDVAWGRRPDLIGKWLGLTPTCKDMVLGKQDYDDGRDKAEDLAVIGTHLVPVSWVRRAEK